MTLRFQSPDWHDSLPSTNTDLRQRLRQGEALADGYVLAAREQTAGRGRYDRRWSSQPGRDLTFSFVYRSGVPTQQLLSLPMAVALGVHSFLRSADLDAQTKWPNDVQVGGRKICGILAEQAGDCVIVGLGLNVNMTAEEAAAIDQPATSLFMVSGHTTPVERALEELLPHLAKYIDSWQAEGFPAIREEWAAACGQLGLEISVGEGANCRTGWLIGFGDCGQLLLYTEDGTTHEIWAGDVIS